MTTRDGAGAGVSLRDNGGGVRTVGGTAAGGGAGRGAGCGDGFGPVEDDYSAVQSAVGQKPKPEAVYEKLRERAAAMGANAAINVSHKTTYFPLSAVEAKGIAVRLESDEIKCRYCAEWIKREARICRFCGREVQAVVAPTPGRG